MKKKGAFQLSLGLIVIVIFAVVLLSLALAWIQGVFVDVGGLTHTVTQEGIDRIIREIQASGENVGVAAPDLKTWKKGDAGVYQIVVRNTDDVSDLAVTANIFLEEIGGYVGSQTTVAAIQNQVNNDWLTYSKTHSVSPRGMSQVKLAIEAPLGTTAGIYWFKVVVCEGAFATSYQTCIIGGTHPIHGDDGFFIEIVD